MYFVEKTLLELFGDRDSYKLWKNMSMFMHKCSSESCLSHLISLVPGAIVDPDQIVFTRRHSCQLAYIELAGDTFVTSTNRGSVFKYTPSFTVFSTSTFHSIYNDLHPTRFTRLECVLVWISVFVSLLRSELNCKLALFLKWMVVFYDVRLISLAVEYAPLHACYQANRDWETPDACSCLYIFQ